MGALDHVPDTRDGLTHAERQLLHLLGPPKEPHAYSVRVVDAVRREEARRGVEFRQREIYDVLVRMARPFVSRYPLVDGEGNFGSVDDDPAADPQYTEARRTLVGESVARGGAFPALLANGSSGEISSIPSHRLGDVAKAIALRVERPGAGLDDVLVVLRGPDYPTGGEVVDAEQTRAAYETGEGAIDVRGTLDVERRRERALIVVHELPFGVMKGGDDGVIVQIAEMLHERWNAEAGRGAIGIETGISDLQDYSDKRGMRLVIELERGRDPEPALSVLLDRTQLQASVPVRMVALVNGKPEQLTLLDLIDRYIDHQRSLRSGARNDIDAAIVRDLAALDSLYGDERRTRLPGRP